MVPPARINKPGRQLPKSSCSNSFRLCQNSAATTIGTNTAYPSSLSSKPRRPTPKASERKPNSEGEFTYPRVELPRKWNRPTHAALNNRNAPLLGSLDQHLENSRRKSSKTPLLGCVSMFAPDATNGYTTRTRAANKFVRRAPKPKPLRPRLLFHNQLQVRLPAIHPGAFAHEVHDLLLQFPAARSPTTDPGDLLDALS